MRGDAADRTHPPELGDCRDPIEHDPVGVFVLVGGRLSYADAAFLDVLGRSRSELIGRPFEGLVAEEDRPSIAALLDRSSAAIGKIESCRFVRNNGTTRPREVVIRRIDGKDLVIGTVRGAIPQIRSERLHGLWELGKGLTEIGDVGALCERAALYVRDDLDYDFCAIWLTEGAEMVQHGAAANPFFPAGEIPMRGMRIPVEGRGITHLAIKHSEPVIIPDVTRDDRYDGSRTSMRSALAVPLIGRKGPIGVIEVESQRRAAFGGQDLEVLSALGSQLAIAISALRREESLRLINGFGQQIAAASTVEQVVAGTIDFLAEQFDYQLSVLFLGGSEGDLKVAGARGPYGERGVEIGWSLPPGEGIVGWVARNRRYAIVDDVRRDPRYYEAFSGTRSEIAVPVTFSGELYGVLNVESKDPGFFDEEDRRVLEVIANHLVIALSNLASKESLREQAIRDPLTGMYNRHYFNSIIEAEFNRSNRYNHPLTLMMIDIDGFREVNNRLGHLKGDDVLRQIARVIGESVRAADHVIRYGGDEFLILMPETREEAEMVAKRLKERIAKLPEEAGIPGISLGLSIGIYLRPPGEGRSLQAILEEVDRKMYADKREHGPDRTDGHDHPPPDDAR